ncbi:hypothetical protein CLOSYM_02381 [[Clostridium] symbiosum ATCC 14940]|jgi:hypothetical protein|uniref:Uncharacterized protein n=1 Tax=[Clostridium] symbiosum ATCC 14940 TaxID=411472 RepID=A0ABC9TXK9_CLOSY|nr:hypothetical protein CLOSYM_02381 [[Clostridium] symbiosum ATCC 14940]
MKTGHSKYLRPLYHALRKMSAKNWKNVSKKLPIQEASVKKGGSEKRL